MPVLLEGGVNVFATALSDRLQTSERCVGSALARAVREGRAARDEVVVDVSRGGYLTPDAVALALHPDPRRYLVDTYVATGLVDPARVAHGVHSLDGRFLRDQIERSRRNLRLATLDAFLIEEPELHRGECTPDAFRARLCGAFEALEQAVADGAIAAYGLCTWEGFLRPPYDRAHLAVLDAFDWALDVGGGDHHLRYVQLPYSVAMAAAFRLDSQIGPTGPATPSSPRCGAPGPRCSRARRSSRDACSDAFPGRWWRRSPRRAAMRSLPAVRAQHAGDHLRGGRDAGARARRGEPPRDRAPAARRETLEALFEAADARGATG